MGSSTSSEGCTMDNDGKESVRTEIKHDNPDHKIYITDVYWNYKSAGTNNFHRFLEFKFQCKNCNFTKYVRMDKVNSGKKNICCADNCFNQSGLWCWHYNPKKDYYTIDNLIYLFENAPSGYNSLTNNCKHFAQYFWDRIKDCNGD